MKLVKINYQICCDVPGCGSLSTYSLTSGINGLQFHICETCLKKLKQELKKVGA